MLRAKTNLRPPRAKADAAVKPTPPRDLWEQVSRIRERFAPKIPVGAFTCKEYAARFGIKRRTAHAQLESLIAEGSISLAATLGHTKYYVPVEAA